MELLLLSTMDALPFVAFQGLLLQLRQLRKRPTSSTAIEIFLHCSRLQNMIHQSATLGCAPRSPQTHLSFLRACFKTFLLSLLLQALRKQWIRIHFLVITQLAAAARSLVVHAGALYHIINRIADRPINAESHQEDTDINHAPTHTCRSIMLVGLVSTLAEPA
jgi:hypothetical protein